MKKIAFILATLVMSIGVGYLAFAATTWVDAPAGTPPACHAGTPGCDRPIHVGTAAQTRAGALTINADLTANILRDTANNAFFVDPANTGIAGLFAGNVGIGTATTPTAHLEVGGGLRLNTTAQMPVCNASQRGTMWFIQGATNVRDTFRICTRDEAGVFSWFVTSWLVAPTSVTVTPNPHTQNINTTHTISAVVSPAGADQSVTWSLINPIGLTGASISPTGVFSSGSTGGTVTIRATAVIDAAIQGTASVTVLGPTIAVSPSSHDFGHVRVNQTGERNFTVTNIGGGTLSGTATTTAPFSCVANCSYNLGPGSSHNLTIRFTPTSMGHFSRVVTFTGGAGANTSVSGTGRQPLINHCSAGAGQLTVERMTGWHTTPDSRNALCHNGCVTFFGGGRTGKVRELLHGHMVQHPAQFCCGNPWLCSTSHWMNNPDTMAWTCYCF